MVRALIGTSDGIYLLNDGDLQPLGLDGQRVSAVYAVRSNGGMERMLAGTYEDGLYASEDDGKSWERVTDGFTAPCLRTIDTDLLDSGAILAGTEPGRIFRSRDGGRTWAELDGIRDIPRHEDWFLPYSPRAGAVRNVYSPPGSSNRLLASVEVGGLLDSTDGGETWTCSRVTVDTDIHYITGHPQNGSLLFAALGYAGIERESEDPDNRKRGGVARSRDAGKTWEKLFGDYTRAVIIPPNKTDIIIAAPSPNVGRTGRIEVSRDEGETWELASDGIDVPMEDQVEVFVAAPDGAVWGICAGGRLLGASPDELHWRSVLPAGSDVDAESVSFF
jgi:hypothetical protein